MILAGRLLDTVMEWMNGEIRLSEVGTAVLRKKDMIQYLAIMLCSHTTEMRLKSSIGILRRFGAVVPDVQRVGCISEHLLTCPVVERGWDSFPNWMLQRDQTANLTKLEHCAFKDTRDIFMHVLNLFLTLEDDVFETRVSENQVKRLSSRKADKEGYSADGDTDALSCIVF